MHKHEQEQDNMTVIEIFLALFIWAIILLAGYLLLIIGG